MLATISTPSQAQESPDTVQNSPAPQEGNAYWINLPPRARASILRFNKGNIPPALQLNPPPMPTKIRYNEPLPMDSPALPWFNYYQDTYTDTVVPGMLAAEGWMTFISPDCQIRLFSNDPAAWRCVADETEQHRQIILQHDVEVAQKAKEAVQAAAQAARDERDPRVHAQRIRACKAQIARFQSELRRERQIGQISGVVNMQTLHSWGQNIVIVQTQMEREYTLYRKYGGTKQLTAL